MMKMMKLPESVGGAGVAVVATIDPAGASGANPPSEEDRCVSGASSLSGMAEETEEESNNSIGWDPIMAPLLLLLLPLLLLLAPPMAPLEWIPDAGSLTLSRLPPWAPEWSLASIVSRSWMSIVDGNTFRGRFSVAESI